LVGTFAAIEANDRSSISVRPAITAPGGATPRSGLPTVSARALPVEARQVLGLIDAGGPFPFVQDGTVFTNAARILPRQTAGY
jgi:ribonuclease T1